MPIEAQLRTNDVWVMLRAACDGIGFTVLPDWLAEEELTRISLRSTW